MSRLRFTKIAQPSTPAANLSEIYVDTADRKLKQIDDNGVVSTLNNDGLQDRNIVSNGGFNIQQRVTAASTAIPGAATTTRAGQVADRWAVTASVVTATARWAQIDTSAAPETGLLSRYYGSMISDTAGRKFMLSQWIINAEMMHLLGQKVRLSIKHNQKVGTGQTYHLGLIQLNSSGTVDTSPAFLSGAWSSVTGTAPAWNTNLAAISPDTSPTGENCTVNGSYADVTSVASTWTRSSCVFTVPTNARNLVVVFFSDATGGSTDNISVAECQLTQGPDIVAYKEPPFAETLIRCQRFFCKSFPLTVVPAASLSVAAAGHGTMGLVGIGGSGVALGSQIGIYFPITMWKTPTITYFTPTASGAVIFRHSGTSPLSQGVTATVASSLTDRGAIVASTNEATANIVAGNLVSVHWTADAELIA